MPHYKQDFQDIRIEKAFQPVSDADLEGRYYLPILLSSVPPDEWMKEFCHFYDGCEKYVGERILQYIDMPFSMSPPSGHSTRKRELAYKLLKSEQVSEKYDLERFIFFQYSIQGQGPHPDTQTNLKNSCEKANEEYRKFMAGQEKIRRGTNVNHELGEEKQNKKDSLAQALVRDWFK